MQLLLGHAKIETTVRYLGVEVDDALRPAEQIELAEDRLAPLLTEYFCNVGKPPLVQ